MLWHISPFYDRETVSDGNCENVEWKNLQQETGGGSKALTQQPAEAQKGVWETQLFLKKKKDCINYRVHKADTSYNIPLSVGATSSTSIRPSSASGTCLHAFTRDDGATPCFEKIRVSVEVS